MQARNRWCQFLTLCLLVTTTISLVAVPPCLAKPDSSSGQTTVQDASAGAADDAQSASPTGTDVDVTPDTSAVICSRYKQPGVSLLNVFTSLLVDGAVIVLLIAFIVSFKILSCAAVWHTGKLLRGGQKPAVG